MLLCPRCREPLTDPPEAFCPRCGAAVERAVDGLLPAPEPEAEAEAEAEAPPVPPEAPAPPPPPGIPWDDRARLGFTTALVDTTVQVLRAPGDFYRRMRPTGGVGSALFYAVIVAYAGFVVTVLYEWIFQMIVGPQTPELGFGPGVDRAVAMMQGGSPLVRLVAAPLGLAAAAFIGAAINHLALMLVSGARRGFEATFRVCAFANAANVASLLPICGPFVASVWFMVLCIIGLSVVHGISWQKATAAVLLPLAVLCCCCAGGVGVVAALVGAAAR
jgi:hypothetical protein